MKTLRQRIDWSVKPLTESSIKTTKSITTASQAEQLKSALVRTLSAEYTEVGPRMVFQAVNEAHALASLTFVPLLVLPALAEEKVQKAAAWAAHQRAVLSGDHLAFAA
jgi:energy-converting hydrogenase Eha subunit E